MMILPCPFDRIAHDMLIEGNCSCTVSDVWILATDLRAIADEDYSAEEDYEAAYLSQSTLLQRVGGLSNLRGYLACLHAGQKARASCS